MVIVFLRPTEAASILSQAGKKSLVSMPYGLCPIYKDT